MEMMLAKRVTSWGEREWKRSGRAFAQPDTTASHSCSNVLYPIFSEPAYILRSIFVTSWIKCHLLCPAAAGRQVHLAGKSEPFSSGLCLECSMDIFSLSWRASINPGDRCGWKSQQLPTATHIQKHLTHMTQSCLVTTQRCYSGTIFLTRFSFSLPWLMRCSFTWFGWVIMIQSIQHQGKGLLRKKNTQKTTSWVVFFHKKGDENGCQRICFFLRSS